jgi:glycosyltransferase involved in cell wall biosynthesis
LLPTGVAWENWLGSYEAYTIRKWSQVRIIHVTNNAQKSTLGVEKEATDLAVAQRARGSDVMMAVDSQGIFTATCRDHGISLMVHDGLGRSPGRSDEMTREKAIQDFIECLKSFRPDIIHCHSPHAGLVAIPAGNRLNIPCVFTNDSAQPVIAARESGMRFAVICITEASFKQLKSELTGTGVYYVPNGTRGLPLAQALRTKVDRSAGLVFAGSLVRRKGVDVAILAMVELQRRLGRSCPVFNIYGNGPLKEQLTEMTTVLELSNIVQFHGFKSGILERCHSTDVLVLPSRVEASPLVVLEAMSCGIPIVASNVGDVAKMLPDNRYGRVIPPDSIIALADAIESLLADLADGKFNPDLLIERHLSLYSLEKWAERVEAVYRQILLDSVPKRPTFPITSSP